MTDNEIKKGLELTIELILNNKISQLNDEQTHHTCFILASALDAIDVKNEAMQAAINGQETLQEYIAKQDKEIERLKENLRVLTFENLQFIKTNAKTKAEAYKEFWKSLYNECRVYGEQEKFAKSLFLSVADKVLKEMVGEDK